jgi:triphosphoribosyl-dephospho-CoA synthase
MKEAASRGLLLSQRKIEPSEVGVGALIVRCVEDAFSGLSRSNTILGSIILYVPLIVASANTIANTGSFRSRIVKRNLRRILEQTTVDDTLDFYRALHLNLTSGVTARLEESWTDRHERYDIENPDVYQNIREDDLSLYELSMLAKNVDALSREYATGFGRVIDEVYPHLNNTVTGFEDIEEGIVEAFLWILSEHPDGLIAKKAGMERAQEVTATIQKALSETNAEAGLEAKLRMLENELSGNDNRLNPGSTADILSAALLCRLLAMEYPET